MESVFYKYGYKKRFPVTYLFLELFAKSVENSDPESDVTEVLIPVLTAMGHKPPFEEDMLIQILQDMDDYRKKKEETPDKKPASGGKRQFGSEFIKWFGKLDADQTLLMLADWDFEKAYKLYAETPVQIVEKMISTKVEYEWTLAEKDFESVVFGMGGSFKGGGSPDDKTFEIPKSEKDNRARESELKRLGFM